MIHIYGIYRMREKNGMRYSSHAFQQITLSLANGVFHALDDICHAADYVVSGNGQLLHTGWLYPHLAVNSSGCPGNKSSNRAARCNLK